MTDKTKKKITIQTPKGRPLLNWVNKHPLEFVYGYPTQLTEIFNQQNKETVLATPIYS